MNDGIDRHIDHVRELTQRYGPLDIDAPTASMRNPQWFDEEGVATDTRDGLHGRLIGELLATGDAAVGRHAIVLAGAPGAGKSHLRSHELAGEVPGHVLLDVDEVKRDLLVQAERTGAYEAFLKPLEVKRYEAQGERFFPLELSALVHREAARIVADARDDVLSAGLPVIVDGVLSSEVEAVSPSGGSCRAPTTPSTSCAWTSPPKCPSTRSGRGGGMRTSRPSPDEVT